MAIARTGVYVDDYLEYSSTLAGDLQRILSTMRELDDRAHGDDFFPISVFLMFAYLVLPQSPKKCNFKSCPSIMGQTKEQIKYILGVSSHGYDRSNMDDDESERMKKDIEASQDNALNLCTEKVLLARQAYDLIESHIKRLDEDLGQFAEDLKHEGKIPPDEPTVLPPVPVVSRDEKRRFGFSTPQASKKFREREWDRERGMDFDLMPPPGSSKKAGTSMDVDQTIDPNEPTYCICHQISYGDMIACDNENCGGGEWFHYTCVGLTPETRFKGKWFCPTCRNLQ
ncbi:PHD finger protein ING2 [Zea mays]|uniref:PHD finger protein ING n=1 Tax=Zea mays TaxID=4577 RepID=A0A1D6L4A5_MAIZE|nr:PHD finger protein ING2 [Zea mays]